MSDGGAPAGGRLRAGVVRVLAVVLVLFCLFEINYPRLTPQAELAIFALLGTVLAFITTPLAQRWRDRWWSRALDVGLALAAVATYGYVAVQSEPSLRWLWSGDASLGDRAGIETRLDVWVGLVGVLLVLEAARRTVGPALSILSAAFLAYGYFGPSMPDWLFPHRGYGLERLAAQTFLHSQGVFGVALRVMLVYVFLFVVYGAFLEATGATRFIIDTARRLFRGSPGAPAKVAVLSSGLMGSVSGSAVANVATTGTFTIPLMKASGFPPHVAGGVEAAASSGGALVPPVMGAGAYMMLELVDPPVTILQVMKAAIVPSILFYLGLFLVVHFQAQKITAQRAAEPAKDAEIPPLDRVAGVVFAGSLGSLVGFLLAGWTVFRAVTLALGVTFVLAALSSRTRIGLRRGLAAFESAARSAVPLVTAAACVGIVVGVVTLTGIGTALPAALIPLAERSLFLALLLIMTSSIVLGMGLPSAVCYLLLATLIGPALSGLGVVPLAAHFFIFYFGLMSMVTPPVALAGYTAASIAGAGILRTSFAAFGYSLVGFALPFVFIYRPQVLTLAPDGSPASLASILVAATVVAIGTVPLAAGLVGFLFRPLGPRARGLLFASAALLFFPGHWGAFGEWPLSVVDLAGAALLAAVATVTWRGRRGTPAGDSGTLSGP